MTWADDEIRVVVGDDHALFRRLVVMALEEAGDIEVVGEAATGSDAVALGRSLAPDVVLMDVGIPRTGGIEATQELLASNPTTRILLLSASDHVDDLFEAVKAGATGYLLKESSSADIAASVRAVARGHGFVSPMMAATLLDEFAGMAQRSDVSDPTVGVHPPSLSAKERTVLEAMADGDDDATIAPRIGATEDAVRNHVGDILEKLHLHTRAEAVMFALREHLLEP